MGNDYKRLTDFLVGLGINEIEHSDKTYLAHLIGLYNDLRKRGFDDDVCQAGMFHSIYGTELFQGFKLPLESRAQVRALIGERAERLAYWNCAMDRTVFDQALRDGTVRLVDRYTGETVDLSARDFEDLGRVHLYDWLEQVERSKWWDYRRDAYRLLAERLGDAAIADFDQAYSAETAA